METESDLVVVESAPNSAVALMIAGLLQSAGIPAYVAGQHLQDEWAMSQKLLGLLSVDVQVPRNRAEEARKLIAETREANRARGDDDELTDVEAPPED